MKNFHLPSFLLGLGAFVAVSYVAHCYFDLGPWPCQSADPRHLGNLKKIRAA